MIWKFFIEHIPSWELILLLAPGSAVYSALALYGCGLLKLRLGWKTGYTRKLYHFAIFLVAGLVQVAFGYEGTIVYGSSVSLIILYAVWRGTGNVFFEAMAREKDAPRRAWFILAPYAATLSGGVLANFLFPAPIPAFGYLVTGFGDAVAEPIGTRFGRHKYRVPSRRDVPAYRSLEGSAAVFIGSLTALLLACALTGLSLPASLGACLALAAVATLAEAVSPHGWDNFVLQLVSGAGAWLLLF